MHKILVLLLPRCYLSLFHLINAFDSSIKLNPSMARIEKINIKQHWLLQVFRKVVIEINCGRKLFQKVSVKEDGQEVSFNVLSYKKYDTLR